MAKEHQKQLKSSKLTKIGFPLGVSREEIEEILDELDSKLLYLREDKDGQMAYVKAPDRFFRDLALDKAYKIKGRYQQEGTGSTNNVILINVSEAIAKKNGLPTTHKVIDQQWEVETQLSQWT